MVALGVRCRLPVARANRRPRPSTAPSRLARSPSARPSWQSKQAWAPFPAGSFDPTKPDPAKLADVGAWLESAVAPTFTTWHDQTVALGQPASGQEGWKAVVTGLESNVTLVGKQIAAAKAGDAAAFASATRDLQANHAAFIAAAKAAGVAACGDIVSS